MKGARWRVITETAVYVDIMPVGHASGKETSKQRNCCYRANDLYDQRNALFRIAQMSLCSNRSIGKTVVANVLLVERYLIIIGSHDPLSFSRIGYKIA